MNANGVLKRFGLYVVVFSLIFLFASTAFSKMPYRWPKDTGGDIENEGDDANGWHYYVDYHFPEGEDVLEEMIWCEDCGRWEDPYVGEIDGQSGRIVKDGNKWKIIAGVWDLGGGDTAAVNPKLALHPNIDEDLGTKDIRHGRVGIGMNALPGGCSLRIFLVPSNIDGHPDVNSPDRVNLFGTKDNPIIYGPNEPIRGSWPVTIGAEGSGADMTHCNWVIFEFDDPKAGSPGDEGGGERMDDDDDDDSTPDDDDDDDDDSTPADDDDDDMVEFIEDTCPLMTELTVVGSDTQFVEIANFTERTMFLNDLYVSNSPVYYGVVKQDNSVDDISGADGYFNAKFPDDAYILPGEYQTVALQTKADFSAEFGDDPSYTLYDAAGTQMVEAFTGSINSQGDLSKTGEDIMLYKWNGRSDKIYDCDYALFGDMSNFVDKTGISIDGIDADDVDSDYFEDTVDADQSVILEQAHLDGESFNRCENDEGDEEKTGLNNGLDPSQHDETSEDLENTWMVLDTPSPNEAPDCFTGDDDDDDITDDDDSDDDDSDDDDQSPEDLDGLDDDDDDSDNCCG